MEHHGLIESFTDLDDAFQFFDHNLLRFLSEGWTIRDGTSIERVGMKWRVGIILNRGKEDKIDGN